MKKFRDIDIPMMVYQIFRSNYAVRMDEDVDGSVVLSLGKSFKYLVCHLFDLQGLYDKYDPFRRRNFMIASCLPVYGQMSNVLNELYGMYGEIQFADSTSEPVYLYEEGGSDAPVYFYEVGSNQPVYMGFQGGSTTTNIIRIPAALANDQITYSEFIATLNAILMYGLTYTIQTY